MSPSKVEIQQQGSQQIKQDSQQIKQDLQQIKQDSQQIKQDSQQIKQDSQLITNFKNIKNGGEHMQQLTQGHMKLHDIQLEEQKRDILYNNEKITQERIKQKLLNSKELTSDTLSSSGLSSSTSDFEASHNLDFPYSRSSSPVLKEVLKQEQLKKEQKRKLPLYKGFFDDCFNNYVQYHFESGENYSSPSEADQSLPAQHGSQHARQLSPRVQTNNGFSKLDKVAQTVGSQLTTVSSEGDTVHDWERPSLNLYNQPSLTSQSNNNFEFNFNQQKICQQRNSFLISRGDEQIQRQDKQKERKILLDQFQTLDRGKNASIYKNQGKDKLASDIQVMSENIEDSGYVIKLLDQLWSTQKGGSKQADDSINKGTQTQERLDTNIFRGTLSEQQQQEKVQSQHGTSGIREARQQQQETGIPKLHNSICDGIGSVELSDYKELYVQSSNGHSWVGMKQDYGYKLTTLVDGSRFGQLDLLQFNQKFSELCNDHFGGQFGCT